MHRRHRAAPVHEHPVERESEGDVDQHDVPHTEHPAPFLHHDGVDEGRQRNPRHEGGVFHRVPEPESAPAQDGVGPPGTQQQAGRQQRPDADAPGPAGVDPFIAALAADEAAQRESHGDADAHQPGHQRGRVEEHPEVRQQGVDALAVGNAGKGSFGRGWP